MQRLADAVAETERTAIRSALAVSGGPQVDAAKLLGISRATLYEKLALLGLQGARAESAAAAAPGRRKGICVTVHHRSMACVLLQHTRLPAGGRASAYKMRP